LVTPVGVVWEMLLYEDVVTSMPGDVEVSLHGELSMCQDEVLCVVTEFSQDQSVVTSKGEVGELYVVRV